MSATCLCVTPICSPRIAHLPLRHVIRRCPICRAMLLHELTALPSVSRAQDICHVPETVRDGR